MSMKLSEHLKKTDEEAYKGKGDFCDGGAYVRHLYDFALREIFGGKLGIMISDYLIKKALSDNKKK